MRVREKSLSFINQWRGYREQAISIETEIYSRRTEENTDA